MEASTNQDIKFSRTDQDHPIFFQRSLTNIDVIGIRSKKSYETVMIQFIGAWKVGFIYEGGELSEEQVLQVYKDVPSNINDLKYYEAKYQDKVDILVPKKDKYVFIGERVVEKIKTKK